MTYLQPRRDDDSRTKDGSYRQFHRVLQPSSAATRDDVLWTAGFLDAEGCLSWRDGTAIVAVSNCHLPTLMWLCDTFAGSVRPLRPGREAVRPCFQWSVGGGPARALLSAVLPFLREKGAQAELILSEPVGVRGKAMPKSDLARRRELVKELGRLKRISYTPPPAR